jgi:hypothetical protein
MSKILDAQDILTEARNSKIGDAEDIFVEARSYIECVRLAACQLRTCEESEAIAAVAMAAYQKIEEGLALLDECPPPPPPDYRPTRQVRTKRSGK